MKFELKIRGAKGVERTFDKITMYYHKDLKPFFEIVRDWWFDNERMIFITEGTHLLGRQWKKLSDDYAEWKEQNFPKRNILELHGKLSNAMGGGAGSWQKLTRKNMKLGIKWLPYYDTHQNGDRGRNIPKRQFAGTNKDMMRDLDLRIQKHMVALDRELQREAEVIR